MMGDTRSFGEILDDAQGESMEELEENLKEIHESLNQGLIPGHHHGKEGI
jgi:hypothetical protein